VPLRNLSLFRIIGSMFFLVSHDVIIKDKLIGIGKEEEDGTV